MICVQQGYGFMSNYFDHTHTHTHLLWPLVFISFSMLLYVFVCVMKMDCDRKVNTAVASFCWTVAVCSNTDSFTGLQFVHGVLLLRVHTQFVSHHVYCVQCLQGESTIAKLWQNSSLEWSLFVPSTEVRTFVSDRKLDWLENVNVRHIQCYLLISCFAPRQINHFRWKFVNKCSCTWLKAICLVTGYFLLLTIFHGFWWSVFVVH